MPKERMEEPPEQYRCEQCEDCFNTQDDLIYHSAIHATQNLICPLCQEKFDDVEAVTAHIRSHVDGMLFDYSKLSDVKFHMWPIYNAETLPALGSVPYV